MKKLVLAAVVLGGCIYKGPHVPTDLQGDVPIRIANRTSDPICTWRSFRSSALPATTTGWATASSRRDSAGWGARVQGQAGRLPARRRRVRHHVGRGHAQRQAAGPDRDLCRDRRPPRGAAFVPGGEPDPPGADPADRGRRRRGERRRGGARGPELGRLVDGERRRQQRRERRRERRRVGQLVVGRVVVAAGRRTGQRLQARRQRRRQHQRVLHACDQAVARSHEEPVLRSVRRLGVQLEPAAGVRVEIEVRVDHAIGAVARSAASRARAPIVAREPRSSTSWRAPCASAASSTGTSSPVSPSSTTLGRPPTAVVTIGSPAAIASGTTSGRPSVLRRQREHVERGQELRHVHAPARQHDPARIGQLARPRPRPRPARRPVADDHEPHPRRQQRRHRAHEHRLVLASSSRPTVPTTHASPRPSSTRAAARASGSACSGRAGSRSGSCAAGARRVVLRARLRGGRVGDRDERVRRPRGRAPQQPMSARAGVDAVLGVDRRRAREPRGRRAVDQRQRVVRVHDSAPRRRSTRASLARATDRCRRALRHAPDRDAVLANSSAMPPSGAGASDTTATPWPRAFWPIARSSATRSCPPTPRTRARGRSTTRADLPRGPPGGKLAGHGRRQRPASDEDALLASIGIALDGPALGELRAPVRGSHAHPAEQLRVVGFVPATTRSRCRRCSSSSGWRCAI